MSFKASVRCAALNMSGLAAQEAHGKRQDRTSKLRRVRDADPLVFGSLDLRAEYERHTEGVRFNASAKKSVLHFLIRFPPEMIDPDGPLLTGSKEDRQAQILKDAVDFINRTHGGNAVFAARIDRDEEGQSIVDVFACPVYAKPSKRHEPEQWASATKFGKELAKRHEEEIRQRHPEAKPGSLTSPRMVGIALQSEFADFFSQTYDQELTLKVEKVSSRVDRLEKEQHDALERQREDIRRQREYLERDRAKLVADQKKVMEFRDKVVKHSEEVTAGLIHVREREAKLREREQAVLIAQDLICEAVDATIDGSLYVSKSGGLNVKEGPDREEKISRMKQLGSLIGFDRIKTLVGKIAGAIGGLSRPAPVQHVEKKPGTDPSDLLNPEQMERVKRFQTDIGRLKPILDRRKSRDDGSSISPPTPRPGFGYGD